jgi:penicillin amidase
VNSSQAIAQRHRRRSLRIVRVTGISLVLLLLVVILAAVAGCLWLHNAMQAELPQLDGEIELTGLTSPVTVRRDAQGVPHIEAANLDDMLFAQGYVTAQDRLWQMDMARRASAGELAEVLGAKLVERDTVQRVFAFRTTAERITATLPPDQLHQLEAYARGVNLFISTHQDTLPAEFRLLRYQPKPWKPVDTLLIALSMAQTLDESWSDKVSREQITTRLGPTLAADLYPTGSWRDHPPVASEPGISDPQPAIPAIPLDESQASIALPVSDLVRLQQLIGTQRRDCFGCTPGSNEWVVSGAHTASGKPILSNDMHLSHGIPEIWYETELASTGTGAAAFHAAGVTVPGLPFITAGHNDHIAWGFTALYGDVQDIYVEQTDDVNHKDEYLATANGTRTWQPFERSEERIHVRGEPDVVLNLARTVHGPVVSSLLPHEKRTLSLRWTLYDPKSSGLPLYALNTASDWTSFRAALVNWWEPALNVVYADDQGHIGYQAIGFIPQRAGGLQGFPIAPNAAGAGEWTGFLPFDEMPSAFDPEGGILATANSRITPDNYPYQISLEWANPYRNERIWKQLTGRHGLTAADMLKLQTDVYSEVDQQLGFRFAYAIDHSGKTTPQLRAAADLLRKWDGVVSVDAAAPAIVAAAKQAFWPAVLAPKIGDAWKLYAWSEKDYAREQLIAHEPAAWLPPGYKNWNDLLAAVVATGHEQAHAPAKLSEWKYGASHTIAIDHPLFSILRIPGLPELAPAFLRNSDVGPLPQSGDQTTVKQVTAKLGPSQRFTIDWAAPDAATENLVTGQSENPLSPYYRDQWRAWYDGTTFPLPFTSAAVAASATHTLRLVP